MKQGRLVPVDGLRGLAALMVVIEHAHTVTGQSDSDTVFNQMLSFLRSGVNLFFVLSGFCLFYPLTKPGVGANWRRFFYRRARRILPPYYAALAAAMLLPFVVSPVARSAGLVAYPPSLPSGLQIISHLVMLHTFNIATFMGIDGPMWSLGVEVQFYLSFPLAAWLIFRYRLPGVLPIWLIVLVYHGFATVLAYNAAPTVLLAGGNESTMMLYSFFLGQWAPFAFGMATALLVRRRGTRGMPAWQELLVVACAMALIVAVFRYRTPAVWFLAPHAALFPLVGDMVRWLFPFNDMALGLAFSLILYLACVSRSGTGMLLSAPWLVWFGTISYSLYLVHYPILENLAPSVLALRAAPMPTLGLMYLLGVPLAVGCAAVFFWLFERPFLLPPTASLGEATEAQATLQTAS